MHRNSITQLLLISATLISLLSICAQPAYAKPALLFVLDGQSNAGPQGRGSDLNSEWNTIIPDTFIWPKTLGEWIPANPYPNLTGNFGIELSFLKYLKTSFPNHVLALAQRSSGGTSIVAWDKNHSTSQWRAAMTQVNNENKSPQYPLLMDLVNDTKVSILNQPNVDSVTLAGFLWVQIERDSKYRYGAEHYEENLTNLIRNVRADWNTPNLPVMFIEAHTSENNYMDVADAAVRAVERDVPRTNLVLVKDLPTKDGVHFNSEGSVTLGIRFAQAYLEITEGIIPPTPTNGFTPTPQATATPNPNPWDLNEDGVVSILDYSNFIRRVLNDRASWSDLAAFKLALAQP